MSWRLLVVVLVACGDNSGARDDGPRPPEDTATADTAADAFVLPSCASPVAGTTISLRQIVELPNESPLLVTAPPNDPRQFVVIREGTVRILENDMLPSSPFLDLSSVVFLGGEGGLLGLAFHPQYAMNRRFFVYYTRSEPTDTTFNLRDVVARCEASESDPSIANATSCVEILAIKDRRSNHNGGMIEFGRDGYLYIGTGDGGGANDPHGNAQTLEDGRPTSLSIALQGKLLRIDVDREAGGKLYAIPDDNPFLATEVPEVYARGLRNPWRWSFDRATGDLWLGDVGQNTIEEINFVKLGELAGANFGWKVWEGASCFDPPCDTTGVTFPIDEREHAAPVLYNSIIGGQVYRGTCFPDLVGTYLYADHGGGQFASAVIADGVVTISDLVPPQGETFPGGVSSIHEDAYGELFVTKVAGGTASRPGVIYRLEVRP